MVSDHRHPLRVENRQGRAFPQRCLFTSYPAPYAGLSAIGERLCVAIRALARAAHALGADFCVRPVRGAPDGTSRARSENTLGKTQAYAKTENSVEME